MKVSIFGYYGAGNFGDELMLRNLVMHLKQLATVTVVAHDAKPLWIENDNSLDIQIIRLPRRKGLQDYLTTTIQQVKIVSRSDHVIYGGGTFLFDNVTRSYRNLLGIFKIACLCRLLRCDLSLLAIGIGELQTGLGKSIAEFVLRSSCLLTLRDEESYEQARSVVSSTTTLVLRSADLAFLTVDRAVEVRTSNDRFQGLSIVFCGMEFHYRVSVGATEETLSEILARVFDRLVTQGHNIHFVPMQTGVMRDDNRFHLQVIQKMEHSASIIIEDVGEDYSKILDGLARADLVIGMRLHSIVASVQMQTPVLALVISEKVRRFAKEMGLHFLRIGEFDEDVLYSSIQSLIDAVSRNVYPEFTESIVKQRYLAEKTVEAIEKMLC